MALLVGRAVAGQRARAREHASSARSCSHRSRSSSPSDVDPGRRRDPAQPGLPSLNLKQNLEWIERETVRRALDAARGVKKDAAEAMGISQRALSYYLAKHRLEEPGE